jgi:hypothetical protein
VGFLGGWRWVGGRVVIVHVGERISRCCYRVAGVGGGSLDHG